MKLLYFAVEPETAAPVRWLILGTNRVDTVVIDYPVHREEILEIIDIKIILAAGL